MFYVYVKLKPALFQRNKQFIARAIGSDEDPFTMG